MIDKKDFESMRKELATFDSERDTIIKRSRDILSNSKHSIFSVHRGDMKNASALLESARKEINVLRKTISKFSEMESIGAFSSAVQEYVEAYLLFYFINEKKLLPRKATGANTEDYLMGVADFTGELARRAVLMATKKDFKEVEAIKELVDEINGQLLQFNFRNGELRKKYDAVKWNLKKIEDVYYDVKMRGH